MHSEYKEVMLQPCHQKDIERKYITFFTLIGKLLKKWYFICNKQSSRSWGVVNRKLLKLFTEWYSHHWSRIDTGFDVSKFL